MSERFPSLWQYDRTARRWKHVQELGPRKNENERWAETFKRAAPLEAFKIARNRPTGINAP